MHPSRVVCLTVLVLVGATACAEVVRQVPVLNRAAPSKGATASELRDALASWSSSFASLVTAASDRIRAESRERTVRRHTLLWQLRMLPFARDAAFRRDTQEAYVASLALATAQLRYLEAGEGSALFGAQQPIAIDAARRIEADVLEVGKGFLSAKQLARLENQVDGLVARHPIRGVFAADALLQGFESSATGGSFAWVIDLPMVPFRALSGVSDTAAAVHAFNETAREFTESVNELPHLTRWELELLLYDAEELDSTTRALAAVESFASGAERLTGVAETLPEDVGAELSARLEEARATLAELDAALARAETLSGPLVHVADRLGAASTEWTTLLAELRSDDEGEAGRPFDVREYEAAADRIGEASREIRGLVAELGRLESPAAEALVDRIAWRVAALIAVFFAALALYRLLSSRLGRG
jgi:hypothetical protein